VNWAHTTWRHHAVAPRPNGVTEEAAEEKHRVRARSALRLNVQTFESNVVAPPMLTPFWWCQNPPVIMSVTSRVSAPRSGNRV
jgi:hypothetical protein